MVKITSSCCMALIAPGIIPTCLSNLTFVVWSPYYDAVLLSVYPVQGPSGSEVNPFAADVQVVFHNFKHDGKGFFINVCVFAFCWCQSS